MKAAELLNTVLRNDYCSGCGVCTASDGSPFGMQLTGEGRYFPVLTGLENIDGIVCPFAQDAPDETALAGQLYAGAGVHFHEEFGYYRQIYTGHTADEGFRLNGSSGGGVTWMAHELLRRNLTDFVVTVGETGPGTPRYAYRIISNPEEIFATAKSRYYPVSLDGVLEQIRRQPGRYTLIGIPCFIKGIRLLQQQEPVFAERIVFTIGIFCGHLKSTHYLSLLAAQFPAHEEDIVSFDFRHKIPGRPANRYGTAIQLKNGRQLVKPNDQLFGTDWGLGLFKLNACDYCDDIIGETADISFGDAWIPPFEKDWKGTNMVVTRHPVIQKLVDEAIGKGDLVWQPARPEQLLQSQAGGFRHRREGLAYRLWLARKKGRWTPRKRVAPRRIHSRKRRKLYRLRMQIREMSFASAFYRQPDKLRKQLRPIIRRIEKLYRHSLWTRLRLRIKRLVQKHK